MTTEEIKSLNPLSPDFPEEARKLGLHPNEISLLTRLAQTQEENEK